MRYQIVIYFMLAAGTALDINCRAACLSRSVQFVTPAVLDRLNKVK